MIDGLGTSGTTPLHRMPAGAKLLGLAAIATALFLIDRVEVLVLAAVLGLVVARSTGRDIAAIGRDLRGPFVMIAAIGAVDLVLADAATAAVIVPRLVALALFAHAVTLTTTTGAFTETLERALAPLDRRGIVDAGRIALTLTLALRFVPLIVEEAGEIREAQAARGLSGHPLALIVPLVVRVLVRAEEVAQAIDARGFPPSRSPFTSPSPSPVPSPSPRSNRSPVP